MEGSVDGKMGWERGKVKRKKDKWRRVKGGEGKKMFVWMCECF